VLGKRLIATINEMKASPEPGCTLHVLLRVDGENFEVKQVTFNKDGTILMKYIAQSIEVTDLFYEQLATFSLYWSRDQRLYKVSIFAEGETVEL
jgi:hypothetical protein